MPTARGRGSRDPRRAAAADQGADRVSASRVLHIGALEPHPDNIREDAGDVSEIAASMLAHGIIQPLTVIPREDEPGRFWVIAGNRRYYAARRARIEQIPVVIRRDLATPARVTQAMLVDSVRAADQIPSDKARQVAR